MLIHKLFEKLLYRMKKKTLNKQILKNIKYE